MPFAVLVLPLLVLAGPPHAAAAGDDPAAYVLAAPTAESLMLAFDDRGYGQRADVGCGRRAGRPGGRGDPARVPPGWRFLRPGDDDDGWDLNPYERTERA